MPFTAFSYISCFLLVFVLAATACVYVKSVGEIEGIMGTAGMFNVFHSLRMFHVVLV